MKALFLVALLFLFGCGQPRYQQQQASRPMTPLERQQKLQALQMLMQLQQGNTITVRQCGLVNTAGGPIWVACN